MIKQMLVVVVLLSMSTGCACLRGLGVGSSSGSVRTIPTWVGQPVGEVQLVDKTYRVAGEADKTVRTAQVRAVAPNHIQNGNIQRTLCANDARMAIAEYMGWVKSTTSVEGTVTRTTKQVELGVMHGRRVDVEYWTEDFMSPKWQCVGYTKVGTQPNS